MTDLSSSLEAFLARLDRMQTILQRLAAERDLQQFYARAVQEAADFFSVAQSSLALLDPQTGRMVVQEPAIGLDDTQVKDVLIAHMRPQGEVIGELRIANRITGQQLTDEDAHLLDFYAGQLGLMLQNLQRLAQEQRERRLAETLLEVLRAVRQPWHLDATSDDAEVAQRVMLERLLMLLGNVVAYQGASVALREDHILRIVAAHGISAVPGLVGFRWDTSSDLKIWEMVTNGQPIYLADTHNDPRWLRWEGYDHIRAWIGAPIWRPGSTEHTWDDLIGVLNVDGDRINPFTPADIAVAQAFADQIAVVLENRLLYLGLARRIDELALLNRVSSRLSSSLSLEAVLQNTVAEIAEALHVEQVGLILFDWDTGYGRLVAEYRPQLPAVGSEVLIPLAGNLSLAQVLATRAPLAIRDAQHDPLLANVHDVMRQRNVQSILILPLIVRGEVIGTMGLDELKHMRDFTPAEIALAQTITNQAASAIANAQLYEEVRRRANLLQVTQEVASRINAILNADELLWQVVDLLAERFGYYFVSILMVSEDGRYLELRASSGEIGRRVVADGLRLGIGREGICGLVAQTGQTVVVKDVRKEPRYVTHSVLGPARSEIAVPIKLGERVLGVLNVESERLNAFDDADRMALEIMADSIAVALENARLYATAQEHARQLRTAYEQLSVLDRMKDEFVQTVSHELRTPLTFIKGYIELLLEETWGQLTPEQTDALRIVAQRTENITALVNDIITLARAEAGHLNLQPLNLGDIANTAVQSALATAAQAGITLLADIPPDLPPVNGDAQRLAQVFDNLIGNAIKFSRAGGQVCVRVFAVEDAVRAEVSDQGIGIPQDKLDRVWERFYQVEHTSTRRFGGAGLGLAIVKRLVEAHGGRVGVESVLGVGSTFYFILPRAGQESQSQSRSND